MYLKSIECSNQKRHTQKKDTNSKENNTLKYRHHCMHLFFFESTMHTEFSISIEEIYLHLYLNHKNVLQKKTKYFLFLLFSFWLDFNFILHYINYINIKCLPGMCPHIQSVCKLHFRINIQTKHILYMWDWVIDIRYA